MNQKQTIKYLGYYDMLRDGKQVRSYSLAAAKKMDYICHVLGEIGFQVSIVSPSYIVGEDDPYQKQETVQINEHTSLTLTPSIGAPNKLIRIFRVLLSRFWLFIYLLQNCKKNEKILVYHNYTYAMPLILAQKIKRFKIILQIEEQYTMVWNLSRYQKWKEKLLLNYGTKDALVVSELLADKLRVENPIISYGNYSTYQGEIPTKGDGKTITLIYTGSIDRVKGSAFIAMQTMPFLPEKYKLILSGSIAKGDGPIFEETLREINLQSGREAISYAGLLSDDEYHQLLLSADIALNPQQEGDFGAFLFPSKILMYLGYNLPVVSTKGESIVKSAVAHLINFSDEFTPESVAATIQLVDLCETINSKTELQYLNLAFKRQLRALWKEMC